MQNSNLSHQTPASFSRWQMPIRPETYHDRSSHLTAEVVNKAKSEQVLR